MYKDNIFTEFVKDPSKCQWIINNPHTLAFYDQFPGAPIHILVIPKKNYVDVVDFLTHSTIEEQEDFNKTIVEVVKKFSLDDCGFNLKVNTKESHNQKIFHYHMHIMSKGTQQN